MFSTFVEAGSENQNNDWYGGPNFVCSLWVILS